MICHFCSRPITGIELNRRIDIRFRWVEPNLPGPDLVFGDVTDAAERLKFGEHLPLLRAYHRKCWLANKRRQQLQAAKDADPSAQRPPSADWREPVSANLEDIRPHESNRGHRGA